MHYKNPIKSPIVEDILAERSKALVLGTSLRAWVRIPLVSLFHFLCILSNILPNVFFALVVVLCDHDRVPQVSSIVILGTV